MFSYIDIQMRQLFSERLIEIWPQKLTLKFEILKFLRALKVLQGIKKSFEYANWSMKICRILPEILWNSTTATMLMYMRFKPYQVNNLFTVFMGRQEISYVFRTISQTLDFQIIILFGKTTRWNVLVLLHFSLNSPFFTKCNLRTIRISYLLFMIIWG